VKAYQSLIERFVRTRVGARLFVWIATALDRRIIPWSRGRVTSGIGTTHKDNICLLFVRGAKTGKMRCVPLLATRVGDDVVLIASNGGATKHPAWYWNLKKTPDCELEMGGERTHRRAREVTGEERDRLWKAAVSKYPGYGDYAGRAGRTIPVLILESTLWN
jgi:deazaflavin-dependent oxidoreductase (nitroreductase family)